GEGGVGCREEGRAWVRRMWAENRSWVGLVAQAGIAAFVDWVRHPERGRSAVAGEVFGTAPRELARAVSLQQAVEMVRVTIDVVEARVDELAAPGGEAELLEAVLGDTRGVAFAAARVYGGRGLRAQRGGEGRLGRPAGGPRGRLARPRRGGRGRPLVGVGAELVLRPRRGDRGHRRGRRAGRAHRRAAGERAPGRARPARGRAREHAGGGARRYRRSAVGGTKVRRPVR